MYTCGSEISRHGWIRMPTTPVIRPPVRKLTNFGTALEKSYDGLTTLAATFTDTVASTTMTRPITWDRWPRLKRVKSGMFSDSVAQKAIIAIRDAGNTAQNFSPQPSDDGCDRIGPSPPALTSTQLSSAVNATVTSGAAQFSKR